VSCSQRDFSAIGAGALVAFLLVRKLHVEGATAPFIEVCSVGLASALLPSADDIQHGNLARVGDFLATLVGAPASEIRLVLDDEQEISGPGYVVLVSNMPYVGPNYWIGAEASASDGLLDVLFFADQWPHSLRFREMLETPPGSNP
jgi:diacylglycerol kinase family enzyme